MESKKQEEIWEAFGASCSETNESIRKENLTKLLTPQCHYTSSRFDVVGSESLSKE